MSQRINFKSVEALIQAFKDGAKFKITNRRYEGRDLEVAEIIMISDSRFDVKTVHGSRWHFFNLDGTHQEGAAELHLVEPVKRPGVGDILGALAQGKTLHCPKTREVVDGLIFDSVDGLAVALWPTDAKGQRRKDRHPKDLIRFSTNYRPDGTHRHDPARDLVVGEVPVKKRLFATVVGRSNRYDTLGTVTYEITDKTPLPAVGNRVTHGELYAAIGGFPGTVIHVCTFEA